MNLHQRITDRPAAHELADLVRSVQMFLLDGAGESSGILLLDTLDDLTEASIALRTTVANQIGAQS